VWEDGRDGGGYEIYYKRSTDGGVSWGADTRLTNNSDISEGPSVSVYGQVVHVLWFDERDGNFEIYYKRSTDAGISWGADKRLTNDPGPSGNSSVTVSGSVVHVVWTDLRDGNPEIYCKRSTDAGINWGTDKRLTSDPAFSDKPSDAVSGSVVHVVWVDERDYEFGEIYYKRSTDAGVSWGADTRLTNDAGGSGEPSVTVSGSVVYVVWYANRSGEVGIYYKRSTNGGVSWGADTQLSNDPIGSAGSYDPSVTVSGTVVHVVWTDLRDVNNPEIYYKRSTDAGVSWGADTRLTNDSAGSFDASVSVSGTVVHVVWTDERNFSDIYYKRNPTGNSIGIINISSEVPDQFSLSQNYPNPFNPSTIIRFKIKDSRFTTLKVFDILGREVATLVNEQLKPGTYEADWNASNYPSGVYYYKLLATDYTETKKMILIK
jgi:hypothetical protein